MQQITVLIPCLNEELTVGNVVKDFKRELPSAKIIVYDNGSTDRTVQKALAAGAEVRHCFKKGKGNAVKQMFEEIESDIYIIVDGDDTYDAKSVHKLLKPVRSHEADMVVATRMNGFQKEEKKLLHNLGNRIILWQMRFCFPTRITDLLSGYRVMNREVVKSLNLLSSGFTIETEMTIKALENGLKIKEIPCPYRKRPAGSKSKLSSFTDGWTILTQVLSLFRDYRPMQFFLIFSIISFSVSVGFGINVLFEYARFHTIHRYGSMIFGLFFLLLTILFIMMGFIGSSIHASKIEMLNLMQNIRRRL
ncbi:MAG: glycosyltransferase family 2 protein, partial [Nanoarchaeota archaeon]